MIQPRGFADTAANFERPISLDDLDRGARNLLVNCAGIQPGQSVLIVHEDPGLGWYDADAPSAVAKTAQALGANVTMLSAPSADIAPPELKLAFELSDAVIFFARIGDRQRFSSEMSGHVCVVSYARTAAALASDFGTRDHHAMVTLKDQVDQALHNAEEIHITCPLGTNLVGPPPRSTEIEDVTIRRFPWCMPAPVLAHGFSGVVALGGWLTPTGARSYDPPCLRLDQTVRAEIQSGRIIKFEGARDVVNKVHEHHERVGEKFSIDPYIMHSWHPGIHPGCAFQGDPAEDPDLWANSVFGSPQWLHFHTCGDYAPGEICWMLGNFKVTIDGKPVWNAGELLM